MLTQDKLNRLSQVADVIDRMITELDAAHAEFDGVGNEEYDLYNSLQPCEERDASNHDLNRLCDLNEEILHLRDHMCELFNSLKNYKDEDK